MSNNIRTLTIYFDNEISHHEIPLFRGAILNILGDKANILFHNHTGETTFRYAYPLIQYKRIHGKAAIVCIGEGTDQIVEILTAENYRCKIGDKETELTFTNITNRRIPVGCDEKIHTYTLRRWLPLNSENYELFNSIDNMVDRIVMLEGILTANILSFLKGVDIHIEENLDCTISKILRQDVIKYKGIGRTSFDVEFTANIRLPNNIGIGKNASVGFGVIHEKQ